MYKPILTAGICLIIASLASAERLVCYYDSSARLRAEGGRVLISDIDPSLCTHLVYGFASISTSNELVPVTPLDAMRYNAFNDLKNSNANLKTILSVGGPEFDTTRFKNVAVSQKSRMTFITSAIALLREENFDGLNLDWRYPDNPAEKQQFTNLCKDIRKEFDQNALLTQRGVLLLTASVSAEKTVIDDAYDIAEIQKSLDFINVMTYNLLPTTSITQHHSPLFAGSGDAQLNADYAMKYWRDMGTDTAKLNMGIPAFGRSFTLSSADTALGAPVSGEGEQGCFTGVDGFWASYESCIYLEGASIQRISGQQVPFATIEDQWLGFDDTTSIEAKMNYIKTNNYGGAFLSSLDLDDFSGQYCKNGQYPLINQLHAGLVTATPVGNNAGATTRAPLPATDAPTTGAAAATTRAPLPETDAPTTGAAAATTRAPLPATNAATTRAANVGVTTAGSSQLDEGTYCVGRDTGNHPHPFIPEKYITCVHGRTFIRDCPAGLTYNEICKCCA